MIEWATAFSLKEKHLGWIIEIQRMVEHIERIAQRSSIARTTVGAYVSLPT